MPKSGIPRGGCRFFTLDGAVSARASASLSSSTALSAWREEAMESLSFRTVMFFSSSSTNFCIRSPDLTAQEPFSMMAKVRFWRFRAFMSSR